MRRKLTEKRAAKLAAAATSKTLSEQEEATLDRDVTTSLWKAAITRAGAQVGWCRLTLSNPSRNRLELSA
jgi:hypothetical protein